MAFFNEFPFTRTYDSDLAWLIRRMKEVLARMDSVEERMAALEQLVADFIASLNIEQAIKDALIVMIQEGVFDDLLNQLFNNYTATINQRIDAQDSTLAAAIAAQNERIGTLEQQINGVIQNFMQSVNDRIAAIENSLSGFYTKSEIDAMVGTLASKINNYHSYGDGGLSIGFGTSETNIQNNSFYDVATVGNLLQLTLNNVNFVSSSATTSGKKTFPINGIDALCALGGFYVPTIRGVGNQSSGIRVVSESKVGGASAGSYGIEFVHFLCGPDTDNKLSITIPYPNSTGNNKTYVGSVATAFIPIVYNT